MHRLNLSQMKVWTEHCSEVEYRQCHRVVCWQQATVTTILQPSDANYNIIAVNKPFTLRLNYFR